MSAGLSLRTGISGSANYSPMTPAAAQSSTSPSISQRAYGITGTGVSNGNVVAGYGSVGVGMLALAGLVYLWWSLPR